MPVLSSTLTSANWSVPGKPVLAAVFKQQAHRRVILIGALERAVLKGTLEAQDFRAGLGHVHIDGIELLHGGQRAGLVFRHQRARRHQRATAPPGDGGGHFGIGQTDARVFHGGLVDAHVGERLLVGGLGVFEFLLADRADVHQILKTLHLQARGGYVGLGAGEVGLRAVEIGLIGGGINLVKDIPGLDVRAFHKETLLDDAAHLRTHFSDLETRRAAGKFRRIQHLLRGHDLHGHFHGGSRLGLGPVFSSLQPMRDKQPRSPANKVTPNRKGRRSCFTNI